MGRPRTNKSTIKNDPFASVIPVPPEVEVAPTTIEIPSVTIEAEPPVRSAPIENADQPRRTKPIEVPTKTGKQKLTVHLDAALADRVKNAAYWNPRLTIAAIAEQGIRHAIEKHEREHGGKYPPREGELLGGRPIK